MKYDMDIAKTRNYRMKNLVALQIKSSNVNM